MASAGGRRVIAIDGRMIHQDQAHGVARVIIEFVRHLPADRDEVVLVLAGDRSERFDIGDLREHVRVEYCSAPIGAPWRTRSLRRLLARIGADVFFSPYHALAPLSVPCPLVVGLHDCILESDRRLSGGFLRALAYRVNTRRVLRAASAVVVPSQTTASVLPAFYATVPPATVCPNGVDVAAWQQPADVDAVRARFGLPQQYVLHVGARRPHKNHRVLLEALATMSADTSLVLVGHRDPRVQDEVDGLIVSLGLDERVICIDDTTDAELRALYAGAALLAFPSVNEGFGLPPLEAMAAGVPVVASAIPVVAEVCDDAAVLVSPFSPEQWAAAMQSVLDSHSLRDRLVQSGHKVAADATWALGAERLHTVLAAVARAGATP